MTIWYTLVGWWEQEHKDIQTRPIPTGWMPHGEPQTTFKEAEKNWLDAIRLCGGDVVVLVRVEDADTQQQSFHVDFWHGRFVSPVALLATASVPVSNAVHEAINAWKS